MRGFPGLPTQLTFFPPEVWQPRSEAIHTLAQLTPSFYHRTSLIFTLMCLVMYIPCSVHIPLFLPIITEPTDTQSKELLNLGHSSKQIFE